MAMSRDPRSKFQKILFFPSSAFNIRKSYKISSRKALYFRNYQPKASSGGEHPPTSGFRVNDDILLQELESYSIKGNKVIFSQSYLEKRIQAWNVMDGPLFFIGVTIFGTFRQFFLKNNAFQTIFFISRPF